MYVVGSCFSLHTFKLCSSLRQKGSQLPVSQVSWKSPTFNVWYIYRNMWLICLVNVGKHTIHRSGQGMSGSVRVGPQKSSNDRRLMIWRVFQFSVGVVCVCVFDACNKHIYHLGTVDASEIRRSPVVDMENVRVSIMFPTVDDGFLKSVVHHLKCSKIF